MPIVTVEMLEGRSRAQKSDLIRNITDAVTSTLDIPPERVRVILAEIPFENYGIGGLPVLEYRKKTEQV